MSSKVIGIILAGGIGSRMKMNTPKQYYKINNKMIIDYSIEKFSTFCDQVIIVCDKKYFHLFENYICIQSGDERYLSLNNAMEYIYANNDDAICITHDSSRPYFEEHEITNMIKEYKQGTCLSLVKKATSTFVYKDEIINRDDLYEVLTPQIIDLKTYFISNKLNKNITDLISYAKINNIQIKYHFTEINVKKITYKDDLNRGYNGHTNI